MPRFMKRCSLCQKVVPCDYCLQKNTLKSEKYKRFICFPHFIFILCYINYSMYMSVYFVSILEHINITNYKAMAI